MSLTPQMFTDDEVKVLNEHPELFQRVQFESWRKGHDAAGEVFALNMHGELFRRARHAAWCEGRDAALEVCEKEQSYREPLPPSGLGQLIRSLKSPYEADGV